MSARTFSHIAVNKRLIRFEVLLQNLITFLSVCISTGENLKIKREADYAFCVHIMLVYTPNFMLPRYCFRQP